MTTDSKEKAPSYGLIDHYDGDKGREYFDWQGQDGITQALYNKHLWQPHLAATDEVLDFGCGGGFLLKVLDVAKKVGVEVNPHAREQAAKMGIEVHFAVGEVPGKFDKVISSHALEHVPHPRQVILELKEKLRGPDSRLMLLLPLDDWRARANRRFDPNDISMHLHTWTPQLIGNLLKTCDLEVLDARVINHGWPPGARRFWNISPSLFHFASWCWALLDRQRQLFAVAKLKG